MGFAVALQCAAEAALFPDRAIYLLAAPSADDVRDEVTAKVEAGEVAPTHAAIKEAVAPP
jgi:hypothetical protein